MALNQKEIEFLNSIEAKIKKYQIPITTKEALNASSGVFIETTYNDKTTEIVDMGIEKFICSASSYYFIQNYCFISVPNMGIIPFNLYYFQAEVLKELFDYKKYTFLKARQCLTEDNFVMTDRGYLSIKDVKTGDEIETIIDGKQSFVDVLDSFSNGEKEVARILTNSGLSVDCTLDHKILTKKGWVKADDLCLNDEIVSLIGKGSFGNFELDNDKFAAFIGYYIANGRYNTVGFTNTNIDYINEMYEIGKMFSNCYPKIDKRKKQKDKMKLDVYDVRFVSKTKNLHEYRPVREFARKFGLNILSKDRCLTNELMNLKENQMSILLNRLYAGDGWITYNKDKRRTNYIKYEIGIGSPCFKLIKQIEYILQTKYNIHGYITEEHDKRNAISNRFWKFRVTQKKSVIDFINKIGIKGKTDKQEIINLIMKELPYNTNQSFEKIRKIVKKEHRRNVYDITTASSDFLTNGLVVHNCGISTVMSFYCLWRALFRPSESIGIVSKKKDAAQDFIKKMKVTLDYLPIFLRQKIVSDNMSSIVFENESEIKSEARSPNAGRSSTLSLLVMDEAAFYGSEHMARSIVASAMPTLTRTGGSLVLISTPNGMFSEGQYYFEQVQASQIHGNTKTEKLLEIDWYEVPDMPNIFPQKGYNHILDAYIQKNYFHNQQLRQELKAIFKPIQDNWKENAWLKTQYDVLGEAKFRQEILHDFITVGSAVFNNEILVKISNKVKDPVIKNVLGNSTIEGLWIWRSPLPNHRYIASCDVSSGTGHDFSTIQVLDVAEYEQVAEFHGHISTPNFGNVIKKVANYFNQAYVVVESNSIGEAVFNSLYYGEYDNYTNVFKQEKTKNNISRMTGWITDVKTRKLIVNEIIDWMTVDDLFNTLKLYSSRLYTELTTWVWDGGKADHQAGSYDDLIIAFALCLYLRNKATSSGASFIIDEKGNTIAQDSKLDTGKIDQGLYGILLDDNNTAGDAIEERYGMGANDYAWLTGQN